MSRASHCCKAGLQFKNVAMEQDKSDTLRFTGSLQTQVSLLNESTSLRQTETSRKSG